MSRLRFVKQGRSLAAFEDSILFAFIFERGNKFVFSFPGEFAYSIHDTPHEARNAVIAAAIARKLEA